MLHLVIILLSFLGLGSGTNDDLNTGVQCGATTDCTTSLKIEQCVTYNMGLYPVPRKLLLQSRAEYRKACTKQEKRSGLPVGGQTEVNIVQVLVT